MRLTQTYSRNCVRYGAAECNYNREPPSATDEVEEGPAIPQDPQEPHSAMNVTWPFSNVLEVPALSLALRSDSSAIDLRTTYHVAGIVNEMMKCNDAHKLCLTTWTLPP